MICTKQNIGATLYLSCMLVLFTLKQQAQITINNSAVINVNEGTVGQPSYLVLNSLGTTPVTTIGITGGIMMESEYNITKWIVGTGTSITLPYYSNNSGSGVQFPLGVSNITNAVGSGSLQFSSTNAVTSGAASFTSGWQNSQYMPSDVTNMNGWNASTYAVDNSANVIDRFWVIDQIGYTTSPSCNLSFGFVNAEANVNGGNAVGLANVLAAEPFDKTAGVLAWANAPTGIYPQGMISNTSPTGTVSGVPVSAGDIGTRYRSWTLVSNISPLPVDLLSFSGICNEDIGVSIKWSTSVEINSSYFTIEKSADGQNFNWLTNINAAGNSTQKQNYSYIDVSDISNSTYYRLSETDKNGSKKIFNIIVVNGCNQEATETINAYSSNDGNINVNVYSLSNQSILFTMYDFTGRLIYQDELVAVKGNNNFTVNPALATAIYMVNVQTNTIALTKRVPILNK